MEPFNCFPVQKSSPACPLSRPLAPLARITSARRSASQRRDGQWGRR